MESQDLMQTIQTIVDYKAKEANAELKHAEAMRDEFSSKGNTKDEQFWDAVAKRSLARWAAYNDVSEVIDLYLK